MRASIHSHAATVNALAVVVTGVVIQAATLCSHGPLYRLRRRSYHHILSLNVLIWVRQYLNMVFVFRHIRIIEMRQRHTV